MLKLKLQHFDHIMQRTDSLEKTLMLRKMEGGRRRGHCIFFFFLNRKCQPTPVFLPRKFHGQKNLGGYSPWGCKGSDKTEGLSAHTHTCILHMDLYYYSPINANIHFMLKAISYTFLKLCHKHPYP